jgi:hypothetical protein
MFGDVCGYRAASLASTVNVRGSWQGSRMNTQTIVTEAEQILQGAAETVTSPYPGECLLCFVARQITEFGCSNTHRFTLHYRDRQAPRASSLISRLSAMGACCCDCEIFLNAYELRPAAVGAYAMGTNVTNASTQALVSEEATPPLCRGVRRGSTQPCSNWGRIPRGYY